MFVDGSVSRYIRRILIFLFTISSDRVHLPKACTSRYLQQLFSGVANRRLLITSFAQTNVVASTLCLKKRPTFKRSLTLSNLNRFSKFLHCWKALKFAIKAI